jgi:hypothetical protein
MQREHAGREVNILWNGRRVRAFVPTLLADRDLTLGTTAVVRTAAAAAAAEVGPCRRGTDGGLCRAHTPPTALGGRRLLLYRRHQGSNCRHRPIRGQPRPKRHKRRVGGIERGSRHRGGSNVRDDNAVS